MRTVLGRQAGWTVATVGSAVAVVLALRLNALAGLALALAVLLFAVVAFVPVGTTAGLLVVAAFVTRFKVQIPGLGFRFEHFALALLLLACFLHARRPVLRRMPTHPELAAIAFVVWAAVSSVANSPSIGKSLTIVGWYVMDVVILWLIVGLIQAGDVQWDHLARVGLWAAAIAGWLAAGLWLVALIHGGSFGVQYDYATGNIAAYGLSSEANILGSQSALWLGIALTLARRHGQRIPMLMLLGLLAGLATSLTRAAWLAAAVMFGVAFFVAGGKSRRYRERRRHRGRSASPIRALATTTAVAAFFFALVIGGGALIGKGLVLFQYRQTTGAYRLNTATTALTDLHQAGWHSLVGLGTNSYGQRHVDLTIPGHPPGYLSILPLVVVYDTGVIGTVLAVAFAVGVLRRGRYGPGTHAGILAALLVAATATNPMWFAYVWIVIALLLTAVDPPPSRRPSEPVEVARERPTPALEPA